LPYRQAAAAVSNLTGQVISHQAGWLAVQEVGKEINKRELRLAEHAKQQKGKGEIETKVLFEEMDGIWLKLQGKSRKAHGVAKEMKVAIAYDGAKQITPQRYELTNKVATANFESAKKFMKRKEGIVAAKYNVDEIDIRIVGGDGANWIKPKPKGNVHFQLDSFHRNKAVLENVSDNEIRKEISRLIYSNQIDLLLEYLEALLNSDLTDEEKEKLQVLLTYFTKNKEGMVLWSRRDFDVPSAPEGKEYRRLGTMESNVFTIIGNRMKGRRACWSMKGGNNLARILCLKHTKRLHTAFEKFKDIVVSEKHAEEITLKLSSNKVSWFVGKGYNGFASFSVPSSMKWLKDLASLKPIS
jgi:hypothetical protein